MTDEAIRIGYGDDAGYQGSPGLDHQTSDAVEAFVAWCNEQGGINGRQVDATYYDAKVTEVTNVMTAACAEEFFLVGELFVFDDGQEPTRRECGLPAVPAAAGTALFANAPLKWEPMPSAIDRASVYGGVTLREMYPEQVKKAGVVYGDYAVMKDRKDQVVEAFTALGWEFQPECAYAYNIAGEADWKPLIQRFKNCGAEVVYYVGAPGPELRERARCRQPVRVPADLVRRHQRLRRRRSRPGTRTASPTTSTSAWRSCRSRRPGRSPAVQQFLDIVEGHGGDPNQIGEQAASAFLLWATAAQACGSDLTRACVGQQLDGIHEWTGGGLHAAADPGNNEPPTCGLLMGMRRTEFVRVSPEEPGTYECDPSYVYDVTGDVVTRHDIGPDRIAPI